MFDRKAEDVKQAYLDTFRTPRGELVLRDLMDMHGITSSLLESTKNKDAAVDPLKLAFFEGQRAVVLRIIKLLEADYVWNK